MNNLFSFPLLFGGEKQQKASRSPFTPFGKNSFFPAFRWRKAAKTTRRFSIIGIKPEITPGNYDLKPDNPGCEMKIAQS